MPKDSHDDVTSCNYRQMTVLQNPLCCLIFLEKCTGAIWGLLLNHTVKVSDRHTSLRRLLNPL